jgi:CBS domain-containing protein
MTRVADLMSSPVVACSDDTSLGEVAALLAGRGIHGVVVLDATGAPVGVIADMDILAGEWLATDTERLEAMRAITAGNLMTSPPVTIDPEAPIGEAAALLRDRRLARLIALSGGRPVGVIATSDLVRHLVGEAVGRESVASVMSCGFVVCRAGTTVRQAARVMTERRTRSLVVVAPDGRALGVVTGTDLLDLVDGTRDLDATAVGDLMHPPITIGPDATLRSAADLMLRHEVHRLVVVDLADLESMPLGVVSTADLVAEMAAPGSVWRD